VRCLALNASFEPITMVPVRRALRLVIDGKAEIVEAEQGRIVRSERLELTRGGTNAWTNVVTACSPCNARKGNHLPEEVGMHPLHQPVEPHFVHLAWAVRRLTAIQS